MSLPSGPIADLVTVVVVVGGCFLAYVAIGDLFDRWFVRSDAEVEHRRWFPRSRSDHPADDPRAFVGGYVDDTYGKGVWSEKKPTAGDERTRTGDDEPFTG